MRITLLGTGCPAAHPRRAGAATLVETVQTRVLFDCGSMVTQRLVEADRPGATLDALVVSHLHSDHLVDFYQLVMTSWHQGRSTPWAVHCPETVVPLIEATLASWKDERELRVAFERRPANPAGLEAACNILQPGKVLTFDDLTVEPVLVEHAPVAPSYGFVLRAGGKTAVLSGDTTVCPALIAAGRDADLLVHEVYLHREMPPVPGVRDQATVDATVSYHTRSDQVGVVARDMRAKALTLTHFVPPDFDRDALLAEVAQSFRGPIFIGEDLMTFDLGRGDVAWDNFRARLL